jgi:hypothetical protein
MNKAGIIAGFLGLVLVILLVVNFFRSQVTSEKLEFVLATSKTTFLVGEPVKVNFKLTNRSDQILTANFHLRFGLERLKLSIAQGDEPPHFYTSIVMKLAAFERRASPKPVTLQPGQALESSEFVSFDVARDQFAFPAEGSYKLKAIHFFYVQDPSKKIESNVVEISVSWPIGKDQEALQFILDNKLERFLTPEAKFFDFDNNVVSKLKEFIKGFPGSTYTPFAQLGLTALCEERPDLPACKPPER